MVILEKEKPLVSVVIPCYNHAQFVQETIRSVIDQDYENIELIIIDDGSKDNSVEVIKKMLPACEERFARFEFRYRQNKGLCATLNEALEWCEGEYFSPTASDDILKKDKISAQLAVMLSKKEKNIIGVFVGIELIDSNNKSLKTRGKEQAFGFKEVFLRTAFMPGQAVMLNRSSIAAVDGYDPDKKIEDLDVFLKLSSVGGRFYSIKQPLVQYRRHDDNLSSKLDVMWPAIYKILSKYERHSLFNHALARSMLIHAHDVQAVNKLNCIDWVVKALVKYPPVVFSKSFAWLLVKMFR
ncbi:glycosyltransferase family 2 protein [Phytopseudomonas dryadis]|uniref:glycosyltransferase family 2 protein n=1 Tax=Pseudomonadaceae TaxID=135621 RepID=UPI0013F17752|nr:MULTISPECIES: glycosyltransferase [Pseudomonas]